MNENELSMAKEKPGYWAVLIPEIRYDETLPDKAKLLYAEISSLTGSTGYCYASNDYFMKLYGIGERTLQRHLKSLADAGYIRIVDGQGGKVRRRIYAGINPLSAYPVKNDGVTPPKMTGPPAKNDGDNNKEISREDHPPKAPQGAGADYVPKKAPDWKPERFAGFWEFYPLHKSKQAAIRAWDRLKPSDDLLAVIGIALRRQKAEALMSGEEWKLHASTYLNQARWTDDPEPRAAEGVGPYRDDGGRREEALPWI